MTRTERYLMKQHDATQNLVRTLNAILTGYPTDEATSKVEIPAEEYDQVCRIVNGWNYRLSTWESGATDNR